MKKLLYRLKEPTPAFFCRLRRLGIILAILSIVILITPVTVPHLLLISCICAFVAGIMLAAVSQLTVDTDAAFLQWIYGKSPHYLPRLINQALLK